MISDFSVSVYFSFDLFFSLVFLDNHDFHVSFTFQRGTFSYVLMFSDCKFIIGDEGGSDIIWYEKPCILLKDNCAIGRERCLKIG